MSFSPADYERIRAGSQASAAAIVPHLFELFTPQTVADVGAGEGWWAREFARLGCKATAFDDYRGARQHDGIEYQWLNLLTDARLGKIYDLVVCLEVAEHLPEDRATALVDLLAYGASVVVFSAAIPGQGGHMHANEQWPDYWAEKFYRRHGLVATEDLRWEFWDHDEVEPWYRQNLLVFAPIQRLDSVQLSTTRHPRSVVHPAIYGWRIAERDELIG